MDNSLQEFNISFYRVSSEAHCEMEVVWDYLPYEGYQYCNSQISNLSSKALYDLDYASFDVDNVMNL